MKKFNIYDNLIELIKILIKAWNEVKKIYNSSFDYYIKKDKSLITEADIVSNRIIVDYLKIFEIPIISEESKNLLYSDKNKHTNYWLLDPLDGTKEFIKKNWEFTIQLALIEWGYPTLWIIYWVVEDVIYFAIKDKWSYKVKITNIDDSLNFEDLLSVSERLQVKKSIKKQLRIVVSRSHIDNNTETFIDRLKKKGYYIELISKGSSLKFCMIAEWEADVYVRYTPLMIWDLAPGHILVEEAWGLVKLLSWKSICYDNKDFKIEDGIIVFNKDFIF